MGKDVKLRGMAAVGSLMLSTKKRGGGKGKRSPRGALNAAHRVLAAAGKPMGGAEITATALGLGYWDSGAGAPINGLVHNLNDSLYHPETKPLAIFTKPSPGVFGLVDNAPAPMPATEPDKAKAVDEGVYVVMVLSERLEALPGVDLPEVTVSAQDIVEYLAGETIADAVDDDSAAQMRENIVTIEKVLADA